MRVLIVDDEPLARRKLRRMLALHAGVDVVGEASDGVAALDQIQLLKPAAIFLDIQMPEVSGLEVAASLPDNGPLCVFVTAFDQYALRAFDEQALDYLLKPVDPERLSLSVTRLRQRLELREQLQRIRPASTTADDHVARPQQLLLHDRGQVHVLRVANIESLQAADNYVSLFCDGREWLMRRTLNSLLDDLGSGFMRVHRSYAIALAAVKAVSSQAKGDALVLLHSGRELACSRTYRGALLQALRASDIVRSASPQQKPNSPQSTG